jgi:hypothetical protein
MNEEVEIRCPYCGEIVTLAMDWDTTGRIVEDCPVCCCPIELEVGRDEWWDPVVTAERSSGQ